jgi:hypothetical protein
MQKLQINKKFANLHIKNNNYTVSPSLPHRSMFSTLIIILSSLFNIVITLILYNNIALKIAISGTLLIYTILNIVNLIIVVKSDPGYLPN